MGVFLAGDGLHTAKQPGVRFVEFVDLVRDATFQDARTNTATQRQPFQV